MGWTSEQIEALSAKGECEVRDVTRIEAAAALYLYERDDLLCYISRMSGEWPNRNIPRKRIKRMNVLREIMEDYAAKILGRDGDPYGLVCGILDIACERYGYDPVVWDLTNELES